MAAADAIGEKARALLRLLGSPIHRTVEEEVGDENTP
jgi:hypothetical protein